MTIRSIPYTHAMLRIVAGFLILCHGGQKLFGWFGGFGSDPGGTAPVMSLMGFAGLLEFFGGAALLLGLLTRPVAFLLSGEMAVAYFMAHQPHGSLPIENRGELAVIFAFLFLFLSVHGSGGLSLDAWRGGRRSLGDRVSDVIHRREGRAA